MPFELPRGGRATEPHDGEHGPAAAHPLPATGQQGVHPTHGAPSSRRTPTPRPTTSSTASSSGARPISSPSVSAELPLQVIAELLGVPQNDRHLVFEWSNRMVGQEDPEYQVTGGAAEQAALELYDYAVRALSARSASTPTRPHERPDRRRGRRRAPQRARARAVLPAAHHRRQRDDPQPHVGRHAYLLRVPRPVAAPGPGPQPPTHGGRGDAAIRHPGHELPPHRHADSSSAARTSPKGDKVVFFHASANRDEEVFETPTASTSSRTPNPT